MTEHVAIDREKVKIRKPHRDRQGRVGAVIDLRLDDGGWNGEYRVHTHGKTEDQVVAEIENVKAKHVAKAARLESFRTIVRTFKIGPARYTLTDISVNNRGTDVELRIKVKDASGHVVIRREVWAGRVEDLPSNEQILLEISAELASLKTAEDEAKNQVQNLRALLNLD